MGRLEGKVAFVTGAARGQGQSPRRSAGRPRAPTSSQPTSARPIDTVKYPAATPADLEETVRQVEALGRAIVAQMPTSATWPGWSRSWPTASPSWGRSTSWSPTPGS